MDKSPKQSKEIISVPNKLTLKHKIFNFFFMILRKRDINQFFCCLLIMIETFTLISYAFSEPHFLTWKIAPEIMIYIKMVIGAFRLTPFFIFLKFDWYLIIWAIIIGIIFLYCILIMFIIKFNKNNSFLYQLGGNITRYFSSIFTSIGFAPFFEILFMMIKCNSNNKVDIIKEPIQCFQGLHILYTFLSIIFIIIQFSLCLLSAVFYFDPFNNKSSTTKVDNTTDIFFYLIKLVIIIRYTFISNEWLSIGIMIILSVFNMKISFDFPSYKSVTIETFVTIRNISLFWIALMLLLCKLTEMMPFDGNIYLLLFGFPLIIITFIVFYHSRKQRLLISSTTMINLNDFYCKLQYLIYLIDNFINKNQSLKVNKEEYNKNEIYLQGFITIHNDTCIIEECPLKKFSENVGNFIIQKTCLLHSINLLFVDGIKMFPQSKKLVMTFIQFNFQNKYNLNTAKTYLAKLEKQRNTIIEDYTIFIIQQSVNAHNNKLLQGNDSDEIMKVEDSIESKFRKLKYLIESSTKLYGEFWGILSTHLSNNLNLNKLYFVGNQLNGFLDEIGILWEKDLKNKKIELENQSIVQLYIFFVREILRNKGKSEEIAKKLNEEQHYEAKKVDNDKFDIDNLEVVLENQDFIFYCRANEKGECIIIQCSNSIVCSLGYTKQDLIGQNINIMMPGMLINGHEKMVQAKVKTLRATTGGNKNDKKLIFILPKTKVGYLFPINAKFTLYNDDDFSNTFIIKAKLESKDSKSVYPLYILTKEDLTIEAFSSSALTIGLTMDLLKKYMVSLHYLIRGCNNFEPLDLSTRYADYEEEPKKVAWIYPDKLFPKNDSQRNSEEDKENLIHESENKFFNLVVAKMKYGDEDTRGFCFRLTDIDRHRNTTDPNDFCTSNNHLILYDILQLKFIKTMVVSNNDHTYKNTKRNEIFNRKKHLNAYFSQKSVAQRPSLKKKKKDGNYDLNNSQVEDGQEEESENKKQILLTKEKILELTGKNSEDVKEFINILPFFGQDISLERMRPSKERYPVGKTSEPLIKITISGFVKRIEDKIKLHPEMLQSKQQQQQQTDSSSISSAYESIKTISSYTSGTSTNLSLSNDYMDSASNVNVSLGHIFNEKSVIYIQVVGLILFILICGMISLEFALSFQFTRDCTRRIDYVNKGYIVLNSLLYTKFFITEGILGQNEKYPNRNPDSPDTKSFVIAMMNEMSYYRQTFANTYAHYSNATVTFSKDITKFTVTTNVSVITISNNIPTVEVMSFFTAMNRIPTSIFYVSTVNDNFLNININDRNAYELMMNLLNDYLLSWRNMTFLLVDDVKLNAVTDKSLLIIYCLSFFISIISLLVLWKLISRFIDDRERPVNLFLTIRKQKFEDLKTSSEAFLNKLLNKFFGNEETEEESMIEYTSVIKPDDIMISKFKQKNEYKQSIKGSSDYLLSMIKMAILFLSINGYMSFKYFYIDSVMSNINHYTDILNITHYCQSDIILKSNIFKSFYYDSTIPILGKDSTQIFNSAYEDFTRYYQELFLLTYTTTTFLSGKYIDLFYKRMYQNIEGVVKKEVIHPEMKIAVSKGFSSVCARYFEVYRMIALLYNKAPGKDFCYKTQFKEINEGLQNVIRPWFDEMVMTLLSVFKEYSDTANLIQVTTYVILLFGIFIIYFFVWKSYEENLKFLLKTSVDLIKLIPEEIKREIVKMLNEEEEKNE